VITLSKIFIYPIKSTAPLELNSAEVLPEGLAHDRRYVVTDDRGRFFTARRFPKMVLIRTELLGSGLRISAPDAAPLTIGPQDFEPDYDPVRVWSDTVAAQRCGKAADNWFSRFLGTDARLYFMGARSRRPSRAGGVVSFADSAPLLVLSENSVADLNTRLETPVEMQNFRPNLVVSGCPAYAEDDWPDFHIGAVSFKSLWRCSRCILTTVHPDTGQLHPQRQPLATLMDYRRGPDDEAYLGRNVAAQNAGLVQTGDEISFLPARSN
jgi:uncharacterized protein YcbX